MESPGASGNQRSFKRSYVACVSCRTRKSRCIVKDKPPCTKCEREHRECRFDHRQRGPKHREPPKWTQQETATTSRQRPLPEVQLPSASPKQLDVSLGSYQGDVLGFSQSPSNTGHSLYDRVRSSIVTGTNDALDILSDAVDRQRSVAASTPSQPTNGPRITPGSFNGVGSTITSLSEPEDSTLDLWDKCRFVRQGLFTAQEAVTYMDLFFEKLQPLSPVIVDQFRNHSAHTHLIHEEAMLCCTILTIASRFFMLPGAGGTSRSHNIHQRLWSHCEMLIKRILLGQEKTSTAKTRAIGTVESLMLISDWHPRALHFPPETDGWDALLISPGYDPVNRRRMNDEAPLIRWKDDVFEPAKRANRMSWMLLGMANNLAYELGVISSQRPEASRSTELQIIRSLRAQKLLYVYLTQTATRLGYPSVFPESIAVTASRLPFQNSDEPAHRSWMAYMDLSLELTQLSRTASSMFFQSAAHLQSQVLGDHYADLLEHFSTSLSKWQQKYDSVCKDINEPLRDSLLIEYHHLKACTGAISIQAVVSRASSAGFTTTNADPDEVLSAFITPKDARFLQEVISDSKKLLRIATMSDFKAQLPYAPARVKISVISSSVFLLKALSVGSTHTDVNDALYVLDQCTSTLNSSPPDDMDFALRYAALIEKHTAQFRAHLTASRGQGSGEQHIRSVPPNGVSGNEAEGAEGYMGNMGTSEDDLGFVGFDAGDTWVSLPFDSSIAPFGGGCDQLSLGLDIDSLNFLWSLPGLGPE
ncbi:Zn(2)-C6 fungal-type domain-containing protein [Fusarium sp. LHS14.1]|nr:Zn(2)-C6 fungal-type domain-containing protein [Fusarium sp. LHS14.1]